MKPKNFSVNTSQSTRNNNPLLPKSIRGCIIGKSGCGKTNLLMCLLLDKFDGIEWLDYDHLYIYGKSLHQPEYKLLDKCFQYNNSKKDILNCIKNKKDPTHKYTNKIQIEMHDNDLNIKDPTDFNVNHKNLIIFDDVMLEGQSTIESFYTRGRHNNIDCFYIAQNYFKLPRQTIRENSNLFILFQQDKISIDHFYRDHCSDVSKEEFDLLCNTAWNEKYGFIIVDMTKNKYEGKYRKDLNLFYFPLNKKQQVLSIGKGFFKINQIPF